jgi:transposase InsO family protein
MNKITQEAKMRQGAVKLALRKGKSYSAVKYGVSLSSVKRWCKRYGGTWQSLAERSHRPHSHPAMQTDAEESIIKKAFKDKFFRYGWDGVYEEAVKNGYKRSYSGLVYAGKRMGLVGDQKPQKPPRQFRKYPELTIPGEKVQIDVKEVPYSCLKGAVKRDDKHLYQWTAIDECTRIRFLYGYEEHTPENSVDFFRRLQKEFPFKIRTVQTDNGTEFTYKYISDTERSPLEKHLDALGISHKLIPPRTPWHNGKVERSHRRDQQYFYDWEKFSSVDELNQKLEVHLKWSNQKTMRVIDRKSPIQKLNEIMTIA